MKNNCFIKKSAGIILSLFLYCSFTNAQEGRLPTKEEIAIKMNLEEVYKKSDPKALHTTRHLMTTGPEQDCASASSVCQQSYTQSNSYSGYGNTQEVVGTCLTMQETNSVWYTFTVQNSGTFTFMLNTANDYDFALYDITTIGCAGVPSATPARCNYSSTYGSTGLTLPVSATIPLSIGAAGIPTMPGLNVTAGQTFALIIDNYTGDINGYSLTFGSGAGSALIFDNTPPDFGTVTQPCNSNYVNLTFSEPVQCSSILTNGSNFTITGPGALNVPVTGASGNLCSTGASTTNYATINFDTAGLINGTTYTVSLTNPILDKCGNAMPIQSATFQYIYIPPVTLSVSNPNICSGGSSTISISGPNNISGIAYSWFPVAGTYDSLVVSPTSTTTYIATATFGGCSQSATAIVSVSQPPVITGVTTVCNGDLAVLTTTLPYVTYNWSNSSNNDSIFVSSGSYTVTVVDLYGCTTTSAPVNVSAFNYSLSLTGNNSYCAGQNLTLTAIANPTSGVSYQWSTGGTTPNISVNSGGNYMVTISYPNGCATDTSVTVISPLPLPTPLILGNLITCHVTPTNLYIDSAALYSNFVWSNASSNDSLSTLNGTFTITVTDVNGCVGTSPPVTVVNSNPTVTISGAQPFCPGDSILLTGHPSITAGVNYLWSTTAITQTDYVSAAGIYYLIVSYSNGCSSSDSVTVTEFSEPNANFITTPPGSTHLGSLVTCTDISTVSGGTISNWYWDFGDASGSHPSSQSPSHLYGENGTFTITLAVQSSNGCWDTIQKNYDVISDIQVPNIFTPNNGGLTGVNQFFYLKNLDYYPNTSLKVYNRWGAKVYESSNYQNNWKGDNHPDGVYYYILDGPKLKEPIIGFVQILR